MLGKFISFTFLFAIFLTGCNSKKCSDNSSNYSDVSVTSHGECCYKTVDQNNSSKNWNHQNADILEFKFNGVREFFEPNNCGPSSCLMFISVLNISSDTLTFNYFFYNNQSSNESLTDGTIFKLAPNSSRSLGKIENYCDYESFESVSNLEVKDIIKY